ncbi:UNVERIFIED_CONTAM: hypothetical protein PYX00_003896 [Menopon gallinae]|uniref:Lysosomal Pro-X carboxypeptidase n=1 Tax=Menopon gallinae TaxID=328185 RepID=A0AAW2I1S6_9NEOP
MSANMSPGCIVFLLLTAFAGSTFAYSYVVKSFEVPVDHFSFSRNDSFRMRYLINDTYWDGKTGPIFFYTGNEGAIEMFADNSGFIWEIAPSFKALIVFAEHRYYGASLPFGDKSLSSPEKSGYLTSQQALADYVDLIEYLRSNQTQVKSPVIAFGGSYGGMLAAYIRMKYPHVVAGAIAASAPIWQFSGMTPCEAFFRITTSDYTAVNQTCSDLIRKSWKTLRNITSQDSGLLWLSKEWKLCKNLTSKDVNDFVEWLGDMYSTLAMANYPYPANFLAELPGHPVKAFCKKLTNGSATGQALLKDLFGGISVYFNYTGRAQCLDWKKNTSAIGEDAWDYQTCTEMVMPMCPDGENDMFEKAPWDLKAYSDKCWAKWKVRPQPLLAERVYGGKNIESHSNIVFSNGLLDPWASGGVLKVNSSKIHTVLIPDGAHHLDLRGRNKDDPGSVRSARARYKQYIHNWITSHRLDTSSKNSAENIFRNLIDFTDDQHP